MPLVLKNYLGHIVAAAGLNEAQTGSPISDYFIKQLGPYFNNNAANVDFHVF